MYRNVKGRTKSVAVKSLMDIQARIPLTAFRNLSFSHRIMITAELPAKLRPPIMMIMMESDRCSVVEM